MFVLGGTCVRFSDVPTSRIENSTERRISAQQTTRFLRRSTAGSQYNSTRNTNSTVTRPGTVIVKSRELNLAKTLLLVTSAFLVLNLPSYLCRIFLPTYPNHLWEAYAWYFSYRIYYCHHALLFYLYIFNSPQMRKQLKPTALKLLECYCLKNVPDFGHQDV